MGRDAARPSPQLSPLDDGRIRARGGAITFTIKRGFSWPAAGNGCSDMVVRSARLADNEAVFRAGNEALASSSGGAGAAQPYLCECGDEACFETVLLARVGYEAVRAYPARFFVVPGHQDLTAEEIVIEEFDGYVVVEKQGEAQEVVERSYRGGE